MDIVDELVKRGANIFLENKRGQKPIHIASGKCKDLLQTKMEEFNLKADQISESLVNEEETKKLQRKQSNRKKEERNSGISTGRRKENAKLDLKERTEHSKPKKKASPIKSNESQTVSEHFGDSNRDDSGEPWIVVNSKKKEMKKEVKEEVNHSNISSNKNTKLQTSLTEQLTKQPQTEKNSWLSIAMKNINTQPLRNKEIHTTNQTSSTSENDQQDYSVSIRIDLLHLISICK